MPTKKRGRKVTETPPPKKKLRSSPGENGHADAEESESAGPRNVPTPSPTDSGDPVLLDDEDASFDPAPSETIATEGLNLTDDETPDKPQRAYGGGGYNALKSFRGQVYTGMAVGGSHTWNYDAGTWKETKQEPDLWKVDYQATKRRARAAPRGSGAPVGAEYHWLIVAHQVPPSFPITIRSNRYAKVGKLNTT